MLARSSRHAALRRLVQVRCLATQTKYHDDDLKLAFDSRDFGRQLVYGSREHAGMFNNRYLSSPAGITKFADESLAKAQKLAADIVNDSGLRNVVRNLDILSDTLCKVIDMVAFVRMSNPDRRVVEAAQAAHEQMFGYMNLLNTSEELYKVLKRVLDDPDVTKDLTDEEKQVGDILLKDFEKSGVQLPPEQRQQFVGLANNISVIGQQFLNQAGPIRNSISMPSKQAWGLDPVLARRLTGMTGRIKLPTHGPISQIALKTMSSEKSRKDLWLAQRTATNEQNQTLKELLMERSKLANMMGRSSFAEYEMEGKMMHGPGNLDQFLTQLSHRIKPAALKEVDNLAQLKQQDDPNSKLSDRLELWDRDYYTAKYLSNKRTKTYAPDSLQAYFSLGSVMQGLSRLFTHIYRIKFVPTETKLGEVWHGDVRRLDVVSETEGNIGVIYCDLFERDGKNPHPAHFTVQCSRQVYPDEPEFDSPPNPELVQQVGEQKFQKPIIALVCDFAHNVQSRDECLLSFTEVETLFHEMGHAMHSMIGRTRLHNVSGTRCAADYVETPSVLMEKFAADPRVVSLFASHYQTGEPLPYQLLQQHLDTQAAFKHMEHYNQVLLTLMDQKMHSEFASNPDFDPHRVYYELEKEHGLFKPHRDSQWHTYFGHLFGYGATYYCYLFDRSIAHLIWTQLFESNPISRDSGEKLMNQMLAWGGARDPWQCIGNVLDNPDLCKGDQRAVEIIGNAFKM